MPSKRYAVSIVQSPEGPEHRFSISRRFAFALLAALVVLPLAYACAARWSANVELSALRAGTSALRLENESYRAATGELTEQIVALQAAIDELGESKLDPAAAAAIAKLPRAVRQRAMGGAGLPAGATRTLVSAAVTSPENTFGVLRDLLGLLEDRLQIVRSHAEQRQALSRATPSIWPVPGWLTGGYGRRTDPFTGEPAPHHGLDIAGDKGQPVFATADGVVQSAAWAGDFGNLVVISHDFGLTTRYAHLSRISVRAGETVERGRVVGHIGSTGRSSGAHLHYEVWANGRPLNPLQLLTAAPRR